MPCGLENEWPLARAHGSRASALFICVYFSASVCVIVFCWTLCVFLKERDAEIDGRLEENSKETKWLVEENKLSFATWFAIM